MTATVRPRLVVALLAGRGAYRAAVQVAPLVLAAGWGAAGFAGYAAATGLCGWAMFVAGGAEKAALKLVPRVPRLAADVTRAVLAIGAAPLVAAVVALAATGSLVALAATYAACVGLVGLLAGLHRLAGRPGSDAAAYLGLAALVGIATAAARVGHWSPRGYLAVLLAAAAVVLVALAARLPRRPRDAGGLVRTSDRTAGPDHGPRDAARPSPGSGKDRALRGRRRVGRPVLRAAALLGVSDLAGAAGVAACYLALDLAGRRAAGGPFYVAALISGFASAALVYVLRLRQPATSLRQRGPAGADAHRRAAGLLTAAAIGAALVLAGLPAVRPGPGALAALTGCEIVLFALVTYAGFRLENTDGRTPAVTATAALAGLAGVAGAATLLVPALGAAGAMAALIVGLGVSAVAMLAGLRIARTRSAAGSGPAATFPAVTFPAVTFPAAMLPAAAHGSATTTARDAVGADGSGAVAVGWWRRRRYARIVRSSFATVPRYREQWAPAGTPLAADPPPVPVADAVTRAEDLVPLRSRARTRRPARARDGVFVDPVLGRVARRRGCGRWHLDRRVHARVTGDGTVAFTVLDRRLPRLVDIALGTDMRMDTCDRHRTPAVAR